MYYEDSIERFKEKGMTGIENKWFIYGVFKNLILDLKAEIACKIDISKYCAKPQDITSSDSRSMLEFCESGKRIFKNQGIIFKIKFSRDCLLVLLLGVHASYEYKVRTFALYNLLFCIYHKQVEVSYSFLEF